MTGQKNRFSTTEKLWNLDDKQLKTPKHDAMVLWLMDKENGKRILNFKNKYVKELSLTTDYYTFKDIQVKSEVPIYCNKNFIGGYADLIYYGIYDLREVYRDDKTEENSVVQRCNKLIEVKPYIDSFGAVLRQINSYREMIDKARAYDSSSYLNAYHIDEYCIFTIDDRFDAQFESQDIKILHPPTDITIDDMMEMFL